MNGQPKFRWQATLSEATARSTAPLIGAVLTMQVDPLESGEHTVVLSNWRERMAEVLARDGAACVWCNRALEVGLVAATTEHVVPRIKGGPSWMENEVAACRRCNGERGHLSPSEWADECERRGWHPRRDVLVRALQSLQAAITERGGQRRARPYVASQLRRLVRYQ